jgi:hypothetical protein
MSRYSGVLLLCLVLALIAGCAQHAADLPSDENRGSTRPLPFDRTPESTGRSATAELAHPTIPAGTPIVIRLQSPVSSANVRAGDIFQGVLDEPVLLANRTVLATGTVVRGSVLAAKSSEPQEPGYLRLTLSSILLENTTLDVHTSSLFAKGSLPLPDKTGMEKQSRPALRGVATAPGAADSSHAQGDAKFSTARRLTFRLLKPLPLPI